MTKKEVASELITWLGDAAVAKKSVKNISAGNANDTVMSFALRWFSKAAVMQTAYVALNAGLANDEMPIDPPSPEFIPDELPENAFDGSNGFDRGDERLPSSFEKYDGE